ncbi:MAG: undecaprenyl-diphosphate phosphatase [Desulfobacteraceae bacterium]
MNWIEAVVLGIVQGLTEFLPVSSSGHLVLFQHLFGLVEPELLFDICVHVGTLAAVLVVFYRDILNLLSTLVRLPGLVRDYGGMGALFTDHPEFRLMVMIVLGCVPTALLGGLFAKIAEQLFGTIWLVGISLLITGTFLWFTRSQKHSGHSIRQMRLKDALLIGLVQGLAIIPGISRSGATISAALYLRLDRELAGRFSFLLAIPAILGAMVLGLDSEAFQTTLPAVTILLGSLAAAAVGLIALVVLLRMVKKGQLHRFAPYCWIAGGVALAISTI